MAKRMLIDAAHPEETRVVVLSGNRLEEFDFESSTKRQIKGNIYLAKVTRVEPSLQAAFVEYGGNRHGFLAFNEIHPDYYRIPIADRQAALDAEREAEEAANAREDDDPHHDHGRHERDRPELDDHDHDHDQGHDHDGESPLYESTGDEPHDDEDGGAERMAHAAPPETIRGPELDPSEAEIVDIEIVEHHEAALDERPYSSSEDAAPSDRWASDATEGGPADAAPMESRAFGENDMASAGEGVSEALREEHLSEAGETEHNHSIETVGGDELEETRRPRARPFRHYKIQEVIKRRQIMLVQVTKEERGNKGAALTTYLSLAGRYCVLMPNTPRGGGVSRKITSAADRRRLKDLMGDLDVPEGMGVIVRTAGSERSKAEIKRDFEYLMRLWDEIRDLTLKSTAPALIYEEGNLIKRAIRDLYARDIDEVVVDGEQGYHTAKTFMKMLMPSHAKRVKLYRDPTVPLFQRNQIEQQIDAIHSPVVQLRSGGYIVINPTEALVAIDVNSGRSTKERNIEETALKTNIEAADEVARQLRLRDLAGLIVIDFIDMEEYRNRGAVERRLKEAMRYDRARIQLGRISPFGLLELSRQRLRPSLVEASTQPCPYCSGTGHVRSIESAALHVLRAIEEEGMRRRSAEVMVTVPTKVALYVLNQKRTTLLQAEGRFGLHVAFTNDDTLVPPAFRLERIRALTPAEAAALPSFVPSPEPEEEEEEDIAIDEEAETEETEPVAAPTPRRASIPVAELANADEEEPSRGTEESSRGGRRHRRRRRGPREEGRERPEARARPAAPEPAPNAVEAAEPAGEDEAGAPGQAQPHEAHASEQSESEAEGERRRRRRGRRGGRRRRQEEHTRGDRAPRTGAERIDEGVELGGADDGPEAEQIELVPPAPEPDMAEHEIAESFAASPAPRETGDGAASIPIRERQAAAAPAKPEAEETAPAGHAEGPPVHEINGPVANPRRGWWRR